jgi:hypothetical protein
VAPSGCTPAGGVNQPRGRGGRHERCDPRWLVARPGVGCLEALRKLAEARAEAGILLAEPRASLVNDLREAGQRLLRLVQGRLAHRADLHAERGDELLHRGLRLLEGAGDAVLRRREVDAELMRLAVARAPPGVQGRNQRVLTHVDAEAGPENGLPQRTRRSHRRRRQSSCRTAGDIHGCGQTASGG